MMDTMIVLYFRIARTQFADVKLHSTIQWYFEWCQRQAYITQANTFWFYCCRAILRRIIEIFCVYDRFILKRLWNTPFCQSPMNGITLSSELPPNEWCRCVADLELQALHKVINIIMLPVLAWDTTKSHSLLFGISKSWKDRRFSIDIHHYDILWVWQISFSAYNKPKR